MEPLKKAHFVLDPESYPSRGIPSLRGQRALSQQGVELGPACNAEARHARAPELPVSADLGIECI